MEWTEKDNGHEVDDDFDDEDASVAYECEEEEATVVAQILSAEDDLVFEHAQCIGHSQTVEL